MSETNEAYKSQNLTHTQRKEGQKEFEHSKDQSKHRKPNIDGHNMAQTKNETDSKDTTETNKKKESMSQTLIDNKDATTMTQGKETTKITDKDDKTEIVIAEDAKQGKATEMCETLAETSVKVGSAVARTKKSYANKVNPSPRKMLPGQSEPGKLQSTSLTSHEFTEVQRKRIASQKFPCNTYRLDKKIRKVSNSLFKSYPLFKMLRIMTRAARQDQMSSSKTFQVHRAQKRKVLMGSKDKKTFQIP